MNIIQKTKLLIKADELYHSLLKNNVTMKNVGQVLLKNWKTTLAGIAVVVIGVLTANHVLTTDQATMITAILSGLGFAASKDGNITGTGTN